MSDVVIKAEALGKKYMIGHQAQNGSYLALRDVLMQNARGLWQKTKDMAAGTPLIQGDSLEEVWALKDVTFEVRRGEVVGVIGRNGAGKSTLLKILSRITEPSAGRVTIKGRVASLLEVGTGFHPELTGRENIYLNGAILGMTRTEIKRKFDEIVAFAEIEKFLDTPVKRYSSGMYVRLAFAVAAHLEPEILLVDEVLAVGDAAFQKKALGKMGDVVHEGRTVLLVSHNMGAVTGLCKRCVWISEGYLQQDGRSNDVVDSYLHSGSSMPSLSLSDRIDRTGNGSARIVGCYISREASALPSMDLLTGDDIYIHLSIDSDQQFQVFVGLQVKGRLGQVVTSFNSREGGFQPVLYPGRNEIMLHVPRCPLLEGSYILDGSLVNAENAVTCDRLGEIAGFSIYPNDLFQTGAPFRGYHGVVFVSHRWILTDHNKQVRVFLADTPSASGNL